MTSIAEPKPRKDGRCVIEECRKPLPPTGSKYAEPDAFCSRQCARSYFGTELDVDVETRRSVLADRIQAQKT